MKSEAQTAAAAPAADVATPDAEAPDAEALYQLMQSRFGLGVDDPKHGFTLAELTAVMAGFDTHPQAGK